MAAYTKSISHKCRMVLVETCSFMNLSDRRRSSNNAASNPFTFVKLNNVLGRRIDQCISSAQGIGANLEHKHHAREVYVDVRSGFGHIKKTTNCGQELARALDFLFLGVFHVAKEFLDAFMHDTLLQHLHLEELADETDEAQSAAFCLGGGMILVRVQFRLLTFLRFLVCFLESLDLHCLGRCDGGSPQSLSKSSLQRQSKYILNKLPPANGLPSEFLMSSS